ncbi:hypothetical protein OB955_25025 [Halobacteria archaeon AArc-m2/3/4]|uniref:Uncharacterized protein n=1 Tax=Natronoglomus mannanivorans TaxID=2979990 RepID=A0ABT2QM07_9EURY|nr:hypothetical protein [Halobacteria archaeon AArc-m2/3/4]
MNAELEDLVVAGPYLAIVVSGTIVRQTVVPERYKGALALALLIAGALAGVAIARSAGVELEGGRCRAATTDGSRCRLERDAGVDLCHVHKRTHDVVLHESAIVEKSGTVPAGELGLEDES